MKNHSLFIATLWAIVLIAAPDQSSFAQKQQASRAAARFAVPEHHAAAAEKAATHNMLIVGQETVFLSHLPMFSGDGFVSPHRYQMILEATFTKPGSDPQALYAADRKAHPETKIYTLGPEKKFVLPNLVASRAKLSAFQASFFRDHLELPDNRPQAEHFTVNVKQVIHFREFTPAAPAARLEYLLFGKGQELFLAHFISAPPDFDQVLAVSFSGRTFTDAELSRGVRLVIARPNTIAERLKETQEADGELRANGATATPVKVKVKALREFYLEEGELRVPADFRQTPEEKKAGFQ